MKLELYNSIISEVRAMTPTDSLKVLEKKFHAVGKKTVWSIYSQEIQRRTKKSIHRHIRPQVAEGYYTWFQEARAAGTKHALVKKAGELDICPSIFGRIILEQYCKHTHEEKAPTDYTELVDKVKIFQMTEDQTLIDDHYLANEVQACNIADKTFGPYMDSYKRSIGQEWEAVLEKKLKQINVPFADEMKLRAFGYDKTPDCKLEVPFAVDGHIINWIESKASFGDPETHSVYLDSQLLAYWNRFGPGLVIYWHGFIDELDVSRDKGVMLMDRFPTPDMITHIPIYRGVSEEKLLERKIKKKLNYKE